MLEHSYIPIIKSALQLLKENGKSEDLAALFINTEIQSPSLLLDFLMEIALTANPQEGMSVGCYSIEHLESAFAEVIQTGTTNLLESAR